MAKLPATRRTAPARQNQSSNSRRLSAKRTDGSKESRNGNSLSKSTGSPSDIFTPTQGGKNDRPRKGLVQLPNLDESFSTKQEEEKPKTGRRPRVNRAQQKRFEEAGPPPKVGTVIGVHGLNGDGNSLKEVSDYLTSAGVNKSGGLIDFADPKTEEQLKGVTPESLRDMEPEQQRELAKKIGLEPEGNIFRVQFKSGTDSSKNNAAQLKLATELALGLTGDSAADVVAHSKGGLDARTYLNDKDERVRSLATIGTPHQGSDAAAAVKGYEAYVSKRSESTPSYPAYKELTPGSDFLNKLNSNWTTQRSRLEGGSLNIAGVGLPVTPKTKGDSVVTEESALQPKSNHVRVPGANHLALTHNVEVLRSLSKFLNSGT